VAPVLRLAATLLDAPARRWAATHTGLRAVERVALGLAALWLGTHGLGAGAIATGVLTAIAAVRSVSRLPLVGAVRSRLYALVSRGLLARDPLAATHAAREDLDGGLVDALTAAEVVFADLLPALLADAAAAVVLAAIVVPFLPLRLIAVAAVALVVAGAVAELVRRAAERAGQRSWDAFTPVADRLALCLHGARDLRGNGTERAALDLVSRSVAMYVRESRAADLVAGLAGRAPLAIAIAIVVGALLADEWARAVPPVKALEEVLVLAGALPAFAGLARGTVDLARATGPLGPLVALASASLPAGGSLSLPEGAPEVRCEGVRFGYEGGAEVLAGVDHGFGIGFHAIAGPNGAGKSTLLSLLAGLAPPSAGHVTVGGIDLAELAPDALRRRIAYLPQRPYLPAGASIGESMRLVAPDAPDVRLRAELERVDLWDRLARRGGLEAKVDALSAGERQRVALARVLARGGSIALLDEPDADLDAAGLTRLVAILREMAVDRVVVVVAHAPTVLDAADSRLSLGPKGGESIDDAAKQDNVGGVSGGRERGRHPGQPTLPSETSPSRTASLVQRRHLTQSAK
jgi:ABC-type transport system involved in cytochrome bd biosynthesis fused ATPase/permease subunit